MFTDGARPHSRYVAAKNTASTIIATSSNFTSVKTDKGVLPPEMAQRSNWGMKHNEVPFRISFQTKTGTQPWKNCVT